MMPTVKLTHLQYTQLNPTTWCATAQVSEPLCLSFGTLWEKSSWLLVSNTSTIHFNKMGGLNWQYCSPRVILSAREIAHQQRQLQRKGVRLLLQQLLNYLELRDILDESDFPYQLIDSKHYVCFSHTGATQKKAVHPNLNQSLNTRSNSKVAVTISRHRPIGIDIETNDVAWHVAQRFYSDNELRVIQSLPTSQRDIITKLLWQIKESFIKIHQYKLAQGLGIDYSYLIADLLKAIKEPSSLWVTADYRSQYHVAILPIQQTVVIF